MAIAVVPGPGGARRWIGGRFPAGLPAPAASADAARDPGIPRAGGWPGSGCISSLLVPAAAPEWPRRRRRGAQDRHFARPNRRRRARAGTVPCRAACPVRLGADPWPDAPPDRLGFACPVWAPPQCAVRDRQGNRRLRPRSHEVRTHVAACGRRSGLCERTSVAPFWANAWTAPCAPPDPSNGRRGGGRQLLRPKGDAVHALAWQSP